VIQNSQKLEPLLELEPLLVSILELKLEALKPQPALGLRHWLLQAKQAPLPLKQESRFLPPCSQSSLITHPAL
tara:strand:- start:444 stop:662 length:219 start_codon:yes stop_codon:yes gene_type:complete